MSKFASNAAAAAAAPAAAAGAGAGRKPSNLVVRLKAKIAKGNAFLSKGAMVKPPAAPPLVAVEKKLGLTTPADLAFRQVAYDHAYQAHLGRCIRGALTAAADQYAESLLPRLKLITATAAKCPGQTLVFQGFGSLSPAVMHELYMALSPMEMCDGLYAVDRWLRVYAKDALLIEAQRVETTLSKLFCQFDMTAPVCTALKKKVVFFDQNDDLPDFDIDFDGMPVYVISEAVPLPPADEHYAVAAADFCNDRIQDPFLPIYSSLGELHRELSSDLIVMNDTNGADELAGLCWYTPHLEARAIPVKRDNNGKFPVAEVMRLLKLYSLPAAVQCNNGSMMIGFYAKPSLSVLADVAAAASPMQLSD